MINAKKSPYLVLIIILWRHNYAIWLFIVTKIAKIWTFQGVLYIYKKYMHMPHCCTKYSSNSWGFHGKVFFTFKLMSRSGILVQKSLKMPLFMKNREIGKNREIFWNGLKIHFRSFVILKIHFPVNFRPYISIFDKVTALLIL